MTTPQITIHNTETGEIETREMNADELAQLESEAELKAAKLEAEAVKAAEKAALLQKLGITEDEARLLLG